MVRLSLSSFQRMASSPWLSRSNILSRSGAPGSPLPLPHQWPDHNDRPPNSNPPAYLLTSPKFNGCGVV